MYAVIVFAFYRSICAGFPLDRFLEALSKVRVHLFLLMGLDSCNFFYSIEFQVDGRCAVGIHWSSDDSP